MYEPKPDQPALSRRDALKAAIAMVGGTVVGGSLPTLAFATEGAPRFFSQPQFDTLQHTVDVLIPETDTPGALAADAHLVIDALMSDWATDEVREKMAGALAALQVEGVATTSPILQEVLKEPGFASGTYDTRTLEAMMAGGAS